MGLSIVHNDVLAVAGTSYIIVRIPQGERLRLAFARNATRPWQRVILYLAETSMPYNPLANAPSDLGTHLVLSNGVQGGKQATVSWNGDIPLADAYRTVMAIFWNCAAGDSLGIGAGVE